MTEFLQLTGIPQIVPNSETRDIRFVLSVSDGGSIKCRSDYGTTAQIAAGLGTALKILQTTLESEGSFVELPAEKLEQVHIQKDQWSDNVFLRLTTMQGIPYVFQIPSQNALELSDLLKTEGSKETRIGQA